jgi:hypothetical protein
MYYVFEHRRSGTHVWIRVADGLEQAKRQAQSLRRKKPGSVFELFEHRKGRLVYSTGTAESKCGVRSVGLGREERKPAHTPPDAFQLPRLKVPIPQAGVPRADSGTVFSFRTKESQR